MSAEIMRELQRLNTRIATLRAELNACETQKSRIEAEIRTICDRLGLASQSGPPKAVDTIEASAEYLRERFG